MTLDLVHEAMQVAFGRDGFHVHAIGSVCSAPDHNDDRSEPREATAALVQVAGTSPGPGASRDFTGGDARPGGPIGPGEQGEVLSWTPLPRR